MVEAGAVGGGVRLVVERLVVEGLTLPLTAAETIGGTCEDTEASDCLEVEVPEFLS